MLNILGYAVAGLCVSSATALVVFGRRRLTAARGYFAAGMASLGGSVALVAPATLAIARELEPLPHTARMLSNTLGMLAACCAVAMLAHALEAPARASTMVRRDFAVLAVVVAARAAVLAYASPPDAGEVTAGLGGSPLMALYVMLHVVYMAIAMLRFGWRIRVFAAGTTSRAVQVGVQLTLLGLVFGGVWAVWKTSVIMVQLYGLDVETAAGPSLMLSGLCALFVAIGGSYAIWSRPLRMLDEHRCRRRAYRQLEPLWTDVAAALPRIHLDAPDATLQEATYRRVIEIRDAQLTLTTYAPAGVHDEATRAALARGDDTDQARVIAEAASLTTGLDAFRRGAAHRIDTTPPSRKMAAAQHAHTLAEAAWLLRVDHARQHDPIVTAIRQQHQDDLPAADRG